MDVIGTGAQYKVVDMHDGSVRKIPLTREESLDVVKSWYAPAEAPESELAIDYPRLALGACRSVQTLVARHPALAGSLGNPVFEGNGAYSQDKVQTFGDALQHAGSLACGRQYIDQYINLMLFHWQYGLAERAFNCTVNNGVDARGDVILLDFGEVTGNKALVRRNISSERWLRSASYTRDIPQGLKAYYRQQFAGRLTMQALDATWKTARKTAGA